MPAGFSPRFPGADGADGAEPSSSRDPQLPRLPMPSRRHERRGIRSSITGPALPDPQGRFARFEYDARGAVQYLQHVFPDELDGVKIGFQAVPLTESTSQHPQYYSIDRAEQTIMLYRIPIQRAKVLHVDDVEHRRFFVEHCVYLAVCEFMGREPWDLLPGRFDHF